MLEYSVPVEIMVPITFDRQSNMKEMYLLVLSWQFLGALVPTEVETVRLPEESS
eukprot:CAMPEP_0116006416 /NCGR_PEP_ID=MMETSP0321-20121206/1716_1 /TAXON_ID=163516 /ORGANISM="Leptocylindrus danicus var. danicus, Strain B650" /LENGTH=53 /DNA_ID=CAMNT_0003474967 /DNA_START=571 /DNA_END=728 /DNA_ORIENTATION=+